VKASVELAGRVLMGLAAAVGTIAGIKKANDCIAFNVRLSEGQRRDAQAQATYNWLDATEGLVAVFWPGRQGG
jgi:hypothetical protein